MWNSKHRETLISLRNQALEGGGSERIKVQHNKGKLTARERLELLFDKDSFVEINTLAEPVTDQDDNDEISVRGGGVVTGYGTVDGRMVCASAQDFTVHAGTVGEYHGKKVCQIMDLAMAMKVPYVAINDSGGARIEEGIMALEGYGGIFLRNVKASGIIPQISVILGPCAGGACYSPAITDFVFMSGEHANMFITGPAIVEAVIGEKTTAKELGGAEVHSTISGVAHFVSESDEEALKSVRRILSYLPDNYEKQPPVVSGIPCDNTAHIEDIVPDNQRMVYDVRDVVMTFVDEGSFMEIQKDFGRSIVIGLARMDGESLGIVANNPKGGIAGSLDIDASEKASRFIRFCDCFNIPILTLVDVPGFLPGTFQEHSGIIRRGAKLLYAFAEATVPKVTLIMRKAFGGAYVAMNSKSLSADIVYAWPITQSAVMGAEGAVSIINKKQIEASPDPRAEKLRLIEQYEKKNMNPYIAAERGFINEVILPEETKKKLSSAFESLKTKSREKCRTHGNIPL